MIFPQEDMPFNSDGLVPDIIINPHAMPKRMTIGQFLETIMGKVCCMKGFEGDATPFNGTSVDDLCKLLGTPIEEGGCGFTESTDPDMGYTGYGNETLYNGMTGQKLACKIFMGPTYYMRSKHMVADKFHARSTGPIQPLTRQPPEGRARMGANRLGEMERDVLIAHGMSNFLKEKFYDTSDAYAVNVDRDTGLLAIGHPGNNTLREDQKNVKSARIPYCLKLLIHELNSIGISARLGLE
jgi:DNA-directed RNA polymerase II subunit RPB2